LTALGRDFLVASEKLERARGSGLAPVLILSLFNGIGGAFRAYDLAGITPMGRIAVDIDEAANRVTLKR